MNQRLNNIGIILAAGEGKRMNSNGKNKTALEFNNKPIIVYAVEVLEKTCDKIIVVIGAYAETVKHALKDNPKIIYAIQKERKGTGHAVQIALQKMQKMNLKAKNVFVGYGDHMMFYTNVVINKMLDKHTDEHASITLLTSEYSDPNSLAWGRIIRNNNNEVIKIVEQKDATDEEREVKEVNPGFYCFNYDFLTDNINKLLPSPHTKELYLTDMIDIAFSKQEKVTAQKVPFENVGIGINNPEQLQKSQLLHKKIHS